MVKSDKNPGGLPISVFESSTTLVPVLLATVRNSFVI
jgi:hypothetical protein